MVGKILIPEIRSLIEARNFAGLREIFRDWPRADVAEVILDLPDDDRVIIFRVLPAALAADVFEYLDVDAQQELLRSMAHEQVAAILNEMSPDDRTALLEEMPSAAARQLIQVAHAGRAAHSHSAPWLSGRKCWPFDDAGFCGRA